MTGNPIIKRTFISDLVPGQNVSDVFVLAEARQGQARNGPFWALKLADASGSVDAKIFSPASQNYPELGSGCVVRVRAAVQTYREQAQLVIDHLEVLTGSLDDPELMRGLIPVSDPEPQVLLEELETLLNAELKHKPWRSLVRKVLGNEDIRARLLVSPGGKAIHHAYAGGLLEHTLAVVRVCQSLCCLYPQLDRETLLTAAAFHDIGKAWELSGGLTPDYTDQGRLLGHILIGLEKLSPILDKTKGLEPGLQDHFKHLLLSHHGANEFGSPKRPKTSEAFVLHYADNLDAKLNTVAEALGDDPAEGAWSGFVRSLDRFVYQPAVTPDPNKEKAASQPDQLCLFPSKA